MELWRPNKIDYVLRGIFKISQDELDEYCTWLLVITMIFVMSFGIFGIFGGVIKYFIDEYWDNLWIKANFFVWLLVSLAFGMFNRRF